MTIQTHHAKLYLTFKLIVKNKIVLKDCNILYTTDLRQLDERIGDFVSSFGDEGYTGLNAASNDSYTYVATPLIIWYESGLETRISNTWSFNKDSSASDVRKYLSNFEGDKAAESWVDSFELTYNKD